MANYINSQMEAMCKIKLQGKVTNAGLTGHDGGGVVVLGAEVREDVGVGSGVVAEPVVVVDAYIAVVDELTRHLLGHRRRRRRHRGVRVSKGRAATAGRGPEAGEEESAAARERGCGWRDRAMRTRRRRMKPRQPVHQPQHLSLPFLFREFGLFRLRFWILVSFVFVYSSYLAGYA